MEAGWVKVFLTGETYQAEMARELLENSGIQAVVFNQEDSSFNTFGDIEVYVPEADEVSACEILKDLKH